MTHNNGYEIRFCHTKRRLSHSELKRRICPTNGVFSTPLCLAFSLCVLAVIAAHNSYADTDSRYLEAARTYADNVLKLGRDVYGDKHTPMFVDGLNIHTYEPPKWKRKGKVWVLSNLASHQNLFRTLDALTIVTGDPKYRKAAENAIVFAFENLTSPNGLLYWGGHIAYDAQADDLCMEQYQHELKCNYPYYELMWQVNQQATKKFLNAFWAAHILDWSNLEMNRHGGTEKSLDEPWGNEYEPDPVFFWGTGLSFINTGSDLFYAGAMLSKLSGQNEPLIWSKRLAHRYVETRNPKTGIGGYQFSQSKTAYCNGPSIRGDRAKYQYGDDFKDHFVVEGTLFPCYGNTPVVRPRICQFLLGEMLGPDGKQFSQWALEELTAWGKVTYRKKDNSFIPMLTDGTSMEGYVCKKDGYFGPKGRVLKAGRAGTIDFWTYALAYRVTGDKFMWEMARNIALGDGYGDIGQTAKEEPKLKANTNSSSPELLLAFLELYKKTAKPPYLKMAQRIGDNILAYQFHKGFFVKSKEHLFCKFDTAAPLVLLHLDAIINNKTTTLPQVWPGRSYFHCPHDDRGRTYDNNVIYNRRIGSKPAADLNTPAKNMRTPLHQAVADGDIEQVKSLISKGADINARDRKGLGGTPLHKAGEKGHKDVAELLIANGADVNAGDNDGITPLHYAAGQGHRTVAELLLASGADMNAKCRNDLIPLHFAALGGSRNVARLFLTKGADVNAKDKDSITPLHYAAKQGHRDVAEFLISRGADVNTKSYVGSTPLHLAAYAGHKDVAKLLIAKGADVNAKSDSGWTPLHRAASTGNKDVAELLIAKRADVNAKNNKGRNALSLAKEKGHKEIVKLLRKHGAKE